jgi:NADP-dependent 3-hydroxy acid dehydrogenase YdfG
MSAAGLSAVRRLPAEKVAIVTGGSAGLGLAVVRVLAERGYHVAAVSRDAARLESALGHLEPSIRDRVVAEPGDVGDDGDAASIIGRVIARHARLDGLVNCAGESPREHQPLTAGTAAGWQRMLATNLTAIFLMCRAALPHLRSSREGYIVNVLSTVAHQAAPGATLYAATKHGALGLTESLIEECRGSSVRVSSLSPGKMDTSVWEHMVTPPSDAERAAMMDPRDVAEIVAWLMERPADIHIPHLTVRPWHREVP